VKGIAIPGFVIDKKTGKPKRAYRMSVSKKIGNKAKADRKEAAWRKLATKT